MEREFVDWLHGTLPPHAALKLGVGDDAAVLNLAGRGEAVVTTDLLADGAHFRAGETPPEQIGHKCLAANLSDLAAMAAEPIACFVALLLPRAGAGESSALELAKGVLEGMKPLASQFEVAIAGGDTNVWDGQLAVSVTVIGMMGGRVPLTRSGAEIGDRLLVTGDLGGSISGGHLRFIPRVNEALLLQKEYTLHAAIDITDGLAIDLQRMAMASGVGAVVKAEAVPVSAAAFQLAGGDSEQALSHAIGDGEDFELLLAVPDGAADCILRDQPLECGVTQVGKIVEQGLWIESLDGGRRPLEPHGYLHG